MKSECWNCGRYGYVESHHAIHGRGKRKQHETPESMYLLCIDCHRGTQGVHGRDGKELDTRIRKDLQARYYAQGRSEDEVRRMMGGKLMITEGEIHR